MTIRPFFLVCLVILLGSDCLSAEPESRPNILVISIDDLNDFPGFMGRYKGAITPNMDALAARGTVFARTHCQFPLCGPSRASLMSGMLPATLGYDTHMKDNALRERAKKLGTQLLHSYFATHGYKTMAVGKICHHHVPSKSADMSGGRGSFSGGTGKLKKNWPQKGTSTDWAMAPERDDQLPDYEAAQWAMDRLKEKHDKPFMLMVGFLRPHVPWYAPKKWFDQYGKRSAINLPPYKASDLDDISDMAKKISILKPYPRTAWAKENGKWQDIVHAYLACTTFTDHYVGEVISTLNQSEYKDNTIVLLFSDHGYHLGEKNTFQKQTLWERSSHVPMIIAGPGIKAQRCERVTSLLDIYPTLVELAGLPANESNEGRSLEPLLKNPEQAWDYPAIIGWKKNSFAVQTERYRYIRYGDGSQELYDHEKDLNEWTNLLSTPEGEQMHRELLEKLNTYIPKK